jgi:hypothetical protein
MLQKMNRRHFLRTAAAAIFALTTTAALLALPDQVVGLFQGQSANLSQHWRGVHDETIPANWTASGDTLHCDGSKVGDLLSKEQFADFELIAEWKISKGGNSGIFFRVTRLPDDRPKAQGLEVQLVDRANYKNKELSPQKDAGSLYEFYAPDPEAIKPHGEWNETRIVAQGNRIQIWLNGKQTCDCQIGSDDWKTRLAKSKFAKSNPEIGTSPKGHLALQDHGNEVWFRNIRLKRL